MKVLYKYKDETFEDIREIIQNNKLEPDYKYIFDEYFPFQLFITGRTFFKGLTVETKIDDAELIAFQKFNSKYFAETIEKHLIGNGFDLASQEHGDWALALSGGMDSSALALTMDPKIVYSGYYDHEDCNELPCSRAIATHIDAEHFIFELSEEDIIVNIGRCMHAIGVPVAGMGSVAEYALLNKIKEKCPDLKTIVMGNGGDEVFMGYWFNHYVMRSLKALKTPIKYNENFFPAQENVQDDIISLMLVLALNRTDNINFLNKDVSMALLKSMGGVFSPMAKIFVTNIGVILPGLMYLVNQIGRSMDIQVLNPLANPDLLLNADKINDAYHEIPKKILRDIFPNMPDIVKTNYTKKGFPMPYHLWGNLDVIMDQAIDSFCSRPIIKDRLVLENIKMAHTGIDRYRWGFYQAEVWFRTFMD